MSILNPDPLVGMRNIGVEDAAQPSADDLRDAELLRNAVSQMQTTANLLHILPSMHTNERWCASIEDAVAFIEEWCGEADRSIARLESGEAAEEREI